MGILTDLAINTVDIQNTTRRIHRGCPTSLSTHFGPPTTAYLSSQMSHENHARLAKPMARTTQPQFMDECDTVRVSQFCKGITWAVKSIKFGYR
jgi:hypothetical protein